MASAPRRRSRSCPAGAGAIGKGPDAIVLPGYEDVPRPPAFTEAVRKVAREQEQAIDNYTPQPAFAGQTRAPKPSKVIPYSVEVFGDPIANPWSIAFLPDGRLLVSEMNKGLRLLDKNGKSLWYISGLPLDFSKRGQQMLDIVPDKDFARTRTLFFLYRVPPKEAGDVGKSEEDFPIHYPQIEMVGRGQLSADDKNLTDVKVLLNTHGIEGRMIQAPDGSLFIDSGPLAGRGIMSRNWTQSQLPGSLMGKVLHINADGSIPADNPFIEKARHPARDLGVRCARRTEHGVRFSGPLVERRERTHGRRRAQSDREGEELRFPDHLVWP